MAVRLHLIAGLLLVLSGCGGKEPAPNEVRILAPAGIVEGVTSFERETGCRVDLRVYDENEDVEAIARRRNADVVARPAPPGREPHVSIDLVRVALARGLEVTIPKKLAAAFDAPGRPAGRRSIVWTLREGGENEVCARRWLARPSSH